MYKEYIDPEFTWKNFSIEEQNKILASERSNNLLDTTKLETFWPNVKNIKDSVRNLLQNYHSEKHTENEDKKINEIIVNDFEDSSSTIVLHQPKRKMRQTF